jgi:hypothetical protein
LDIGRKGKIMEESSIQFREVLEMVRVEAKAMERGE